MAGILNQQQQQKQQDITTTTTNNNIGVIALDVNPIALQRLRDRNPNIKTICTDLAIASDYLNKNNNKDHDPNNIQLVVSLHACGAATDMAISLATANRIPFCMSPCCTAKAIKGRSSSSSSSKRTKTTTTMMPPLSPLSSSSSAYRSGAPQNITYPRSKWLQESLQKAAASATTLSESSSSSPTSTTDSVDSYYEILAKIADVGLGPQTPTEQIVHQQKSKLIIEWDRLMEVYENHNYSVALYRMKQVDDDYYYGKSEILIGIPNELLLTTKTTSASAKNKSNNGIIDDIFL